MSGSSSILFTGNAVDSGPADHGALFDFNFGSVAPGAQVKFTIFYGAAANQQAAMTALGAVGAEAYSLGKPNPAALEQALRMARRTPISLRLPALAAHRSQAAVAWLLYLWAAR